MLGHLGMTVSVPAVTVIRRQIATATIRGLPEIVLQVMDWLVPRAALVSIMAIAVMEIVFCGDIAKLLAS